MINKLLNAYKSLKSSPFSFMSPMPCFPSLRFPGIGLPLLFKLCAIVIDNSAKVYSEVSDCFGLLRHLGEMEVMEPRQMRQATEKLMKLFSSDLDETLGNELIQFGGLVAETLPCDTCVTWESFCDDVSDVQEKSLGCFPQCGGTALRMSDCDD